ncbi:MAG: M56 family metallopeptidase, partial [Planctomycetota bacterium]
PCVFGCLRPTLLVPASTGGESVIGDAVLAHELCHLRQRDCVWRWAGRVAIAWLFFQPLLGVLCRRIDEVCEAVCDDAAVMMTDDRRGYARELVRWSGVGGDAGSEGLAMGAAALRSRLGRRIERVLQSSETRMSARGGRAEAVVMGLAVAAVAIGVNAVCLAHTTAAGLAGVAWVWCMG